jgi:hypothetical protein
MIGKGFLQYSHGHLLHHFLKEILLLKEPLYFVGCQDDENAYATGIHTLQTDQRFILHHLFFPDGKISKCSVQCCGGKESTMLGVFRHPSQMVQDGTLVNSDTVLRGFSLRHHGGCRDRSMGCHTAIGGVSNVFNSAVFHP